YPQKRIRLHGVQEWTRRGFVMEVQQVASRRDFPFTPRNQRVHEPCAAIPRIPLKRIRVIGSGQDSMPALPLPHILDADRLVMLVPDAAAMGGPRIHQQAEISGQRGEWKYQQNE